MYSEMCSEMYSETCSRSSGSVISDQWPAKAGAESAPFASLAVPFEAAGLAFSDEVSPAETATSACDVVLPYRL
jgi:hypothetical protein